MSKFTDLKDPADNTYTGARYTDAYFVAVHGERGVAVIVGFPDCPHCAVLLSRNFTQDKWYCKECETEWNTSELVEALENEIRMEATHEDTE